MATAGALLVGKKRAPGAKSAGEKAGGAKSYGTLIRVTDKFAAALREAASFEGLSMAEFATAHLQSVVEKRFRDAIVRKAKQLGDEK